MLATIEEYLFITNDLKSELAVFRPAVLLFSSVLPATVMISSLNESRDEQLIECWLSVKKVQYEYLARKIVLDSESKTEYYIYCCFTCMILTMINHKLRNCQPTKALKEYWIKNTLVLFLFLGAFLLYAWL